MSDYTEDDVDEIVKAAQHRFENRYLVDAAPRADGDTP